MHNADSAWQVRTLWVDAELRARTDAIDIPPGWEPFHVVSVGRFGWVYHLRRLAPNDSSVLADV